jgi:hypothetical protein
MPEISNYTVRPKELAELIIRASGVHEGRWFLTATFGMSPGNFGPGDGEYFPGIVAMIQSVSIQRETPESLAPPGMAVDAAEVNPRGERAKSKAST